MDKSTEIVMEGFLTIKSLMLLIRMLDKFDSFLVDTDRRTANCVGDNSAVHSYIEEMRDVLADQDLFNLDWERCQELSLILESKYRSMREDVRVASLTEECEEYIEDVEKSMLWHLPDLTTTLTNFWKRS